VTTDYLWDVNRSLPVVLQDGTNTYVYGLDLISATDGSSDQTYYQYDGLGSTVALADDTGTITDTYEYDVFGAVRASTGSSDNPWLFTGEQYDADTGLQYLRARMYDPATGRFLGRDPIPSANQYAYAFNNPVYFVDPYGQWPSVPNPVKAVKSTANAVADVGTAVYKNADDVARAVGPYAAQCAIWGTGGAIASGGVGFLAGATTGCAAGVIAQAAKDIFGPNPFTDCAVWAGAGVKFGLAGAAVGCLTAVASYYGPSNWLAQCGIWGAGNAYSTHIGSWIQHTEAHRGSAALGGCISGALSALAQSGPSPVSAVGPGGSVPNYPRNNNGAHGKE
jgi:RHS repeat-associated protein